jgi:hypothetical protein
MLGKGQLAITNRQSPIVIGRYRFSSALNKFLQLSVLGGPGDFAVSFVTVIIRRSRVLLASKQKGDRVRTPSENPSWRRPLTAADLIGIPQSESDAEAARRSLQSVVNVAKSLSTKHEWQAN